jgi:hypothetical protein
MANAVNPAMRIGWAGPPRPIALMNETSEIAAVIPRIAAPERGRAAAISESSSEHTRHPST